MTNREKYIDGILALQNWTVADGKIVGCNKIACRKCLFYDEKKNIPSLKLTGLRWR